MKVLSKTPIAFESPDHLFPVGTVADNYTNAQFIRETTEYCKRTLGDEKVLRMADLGCAGGQLAVDFSESGWDAVGLEGSDWCLRRGLHNWPLHKNKVLYTADVTEEWKVVRGRKRVYLDLISMWEVMEHFKREDVTKVIDIAMSNLKTGGIICGSIATHPDTRIGSNGIEYKLHQTVETEEVWTKIILEKYTQIPYPFSGKVRVMRHGFNFCLKK